jgi:hypothetical protein
VALPNEGGQRLLTLGFPIEFQEVVTFAEPLHAQTGDDFHSQPGYLQVILSKVPTQLRQSLRAKAWILDEPSLRPRQSNSDPLAPTLHDRLSDSKVYNFLSCNSVVK